MVQLRLEAGGNEGMPKDCYISVRVGEVQKLSRLSGARTYKFPPGNNHRFGKIEVFRRVGAASIDLNPVMQGLREVSINCEDAGFGFLGLRVGVDDAATAEADEGKEKIEEAEKAKTGATKVKAAKEYLNKHSLEVRLSEAMQAVLRERPEDPADFLATRLLAGSKKSGINAGTKLPPISGAPQAPGLDAAAPPPAALQAVPKQPAKLEPLNQKQQPPTPAAAATPTAKPPAALSAWKDYYGENFTNVAKGGYAKLYSKFPACKQEKAKGPKPVATLANFKEYYSQHIPAPSKTVFSSIYGRFASHKAAVAKAAKPQAQATAVGSAPAANSVRLKPSVGTWYMSKPPAVKSFRPAVPKFTFLPSVGSWMSPRLAAAAVEPTVAAPAAAAARAAAAAPAQATAFRLRPSVGTWLAKKPMDVAAAAGAAAKPAAVQVARPPLALMASAGTWLSPRAPTVQRPRIDAVRQLCGLGSAAAMTPDQRGEVERVLSKALMELTGELEGEYYPMPSSPSYPARPGGMTAAEARLLASKGLLFQPSSGDGSCQGVFANGAGDVAAWVNEGSHVRFLVFQAGAEGEAKLELFQNAVAAALQQEGYALL